MLKISKGHVKIAFLAILILALTGCSDGGYDTESRLGASTTILSIESDIVETTDDYGIDGQAGTGDTGEGDNRPNLPEEAITDPLTTDSITVTFTNTLREGSESGTDIMIKSYTITYYSPSGTYPAYAPQKNNVMSLLVKAGASVTADIVLVDLVMKTATPATGFSLRDTFLYDNANFSDTLYAQVDFYGRDILNNEPAVAIVRTTILFNNLLIESDRGNMPDEEPKKEEVKKEAAKEIVLSPLISEYLDDWTKNPTSKVFVKLAEEYRKSGLLEEALHVIEKGLPTTPNYLSANVVLAKIYFDMGEYNNSLEETVKVTTVQTDNLMAQNLLLELYIKKNDKDNALRICDIISYLDPKNEEILTTRKDIDSGDIFRAQAAAESIAADAFSEALVDEYVPPEDQVEEATGYEDEDDEDFATNTVAELYIKQGYIEKGLNIYKELLSESPEEQKLLAKVSELEGVLAEKRSTRAPDAAAEPGESYGTKSPADIVLPGSLSDESAPEDAGSANVYELEITDIKDLEEEGIKIETMNMKTEEGTPFDISQVTEEADVEGNDKKIDRLEGWLKKIQARGGR